MNDLKPLHFFTQSVLPLVYDASLSYYEVLCKCTSYINAILENEEDLTEELESLSTDVENIQSVLENLPLDQLDNIISNISTLQGQVSTLDSGKAPNNHASTANTYGLGTGTKYGHVKLDNSVTGTGNATSGTAATPASVKKCYDKVVFVSGSTQGAINNAAMVNINNDNITANHVVSNIQFSDPSLINGGTITWTTSAGNVTISGSCADTVTLYITLTEV